jgi:hypothetical protein
MRHSGRVKNPLHRQEYFTLRRSNKQVIIPTLWSQHNIADTNRIFPLSMGLRPLFSEGGEIQ